MKTALVLGGTQFFGKRLVQILLENGIEVTIATRGLTPDTFGDQVKRIVIDRENRETLEKAVEGYEWDVVFDQTCYSPIEVKDAVEVLGDKTKRYIFTSTMAVYDFGVDKVESDFDPTTYPIELKSRREYVGMLGYQEAKRVSEAFLYQESPYEVVTVRFPIVIGPDDYTNRLQFHVDHVKNEQAMGIPNLDAKYSFISSKEAAEFLYFIAKSEYVGPFNAGAIGDISLKDLLRKVEQAVGKKAIVQTETESKHTSPYALPSTWTIDVTKASQAGFLFRKLEDILDPLIEKYSAE
ncbi:NAD-dependent epimerase/dehydratase family protein [Bacillus timonensis]|nr:NAD-dependent epimerase/dehydratase family protein [Bacillus timonensis]